jgi:hypothetical protein
MSGTDTEEVLRRALQANDAGARAQPDLDLPLIMARGRRLRVRRRLTAMAGGLCVAAVALGAAQGVAHLTRPSSGPGGGPAAPARPLPASSGYPSRSDKPGFPLKSPGPAAEYPTPSPNPTTAVPKPARLGPSPATLAPSGAPTPSPMASTRAPTAALSSMWTGQQENENTT